MAKLEAKPSKAIRSYQDMVVWNKGVDLIAEIYKLTQSLPANEQFGLTSQMRRAAISVPANVAEGFGRCHAKDFTRFLLIANGSVKELETHLHVCARLGYLQQRQIDTAMNLSTEISKIIFSIKGKLAAR